MTRTTDKGKKSVKKLSVKKETVKNLDSGPGKAKELGDDQLGAVAGGKAGIPTAPAACLLQPTHGVCLRTRPGCEVPTALYTCKA